MRPDAFSSACLQGSRSAAASQLRGPGLLIVGLLGGFTTFSAFGIDTIRLLREGAYLAGSANVLLQVAVGLSAVLASLWLGRAVG